jgi:hypothetical protein
MNGFKFFHFNDNIFFFKLQKEGWIGWVEAFPLVCGLTKIDGWGGGGGDKSTAIRKVLSHFEVFFSIFYSCPRA